MTISNHPLNAKENSGPDYQKSVAPIFKKYCNGCHNSEDNEGELSLETFKEIQKGGENGSILTPGKSGESLLIKVLIGQEEPAMPPEDNEAPTKKEIEILKQWINAGAAGPTGVETPRMTLVTPKIKPSSNKSPITTITQANKNPWLAVAHYGKVVLLNDSNQKMIYQIKNLPGKINSLEFSANDSMLLIGTGLTGLYGKAVLWDIKKKSVIKEFQEHRDILYSATFHPDEKVIATAGYDKKIILWDVSTGKKIKTLKGHNGAVFDLAFSPDGQVIASASDDQTVKVWNIKSGKRLDTLSQPTKQQYSVTFSPDGSKILASGADNRIRIWDYVSKTKLKTNPIRIARFAHEGAITDLQFSPDGKYLVSIADDRTVKLWSANNFSQLHSFPKLPDTPTGIAFSSKKNIFYTGSMNGNLDQFNIPDFNKKGIAANRNKPDQINRQPNNSDWTKITEKEPNDTVQGQPLVSIPAEIKGIINQEKNAKNKDRDLYRFHANAGEKLTFEINAARSKSPLDSHIEILDQNGNRIKQVLLQSIRDSYFTFRGKNSDVSDDFRVFNWEEMELNELLYSNGEVCKLWFYPRGPDSGFRTYPGWGKRHGYFGTTPLSHPLQENCYIVKPYAPDTNIIPNGLPLFTVYYENDDDSLRQLGTDSRLYFEAPEDSDYFVRVTDVRSFQGKDFKYTLSIHPQKPDFEIKVIGKNPNINAGSGKEIRFEVNRIDGFTGEIQLKIENLPPGFQASSPILIQKEQFLAFGVINASKDAPEPTDKNKKSATITAEAFINGIKIVKSFNKLGEIKLNKEPTIELSIIPGGSSEKWIPPEKITELSIEPGQTISAMVRVKRNGKKGIIQFGKDDSGRNLPHGVYVDNMGLNGFMIREGQTEREIFITAAKWVPETTRLFHLKANTDKGQATWPIRIHVKKPQMVKNN